MIFTLLFWFLCIATVIAGIYLLLALLLRDVDFALVAILLAVLIGFFVGLPVMAVWKTHADDLSTVANQQLIIAIQQERIASLTARLEAFDFPDGAIFNADSPVASIVAALTASEEELVKAQRHRALAIRAIEARRLGPMSNVIKFVGDYRETATANP